ncbi:MAG: hypothetical protein ABSF32_07785 [Ignavibacteria bacterium]
MLKKHLTVLLLLVMAIGAYSQSIPSGTARYEALGYNPFIMDAATDINRNPAWTGMYRNYTFGDIGRATGNGSDFYLDNQYGGINFGISKTVTLGMVLNKDESLWSSFNDPYASYTPGGVGVSAPIVPFKGLFSYSTKTMNLGIAPYFAMWSNDNIQTLAASGETPATTNEQKRSSYTLGGSIGVVTKVKSGWIEGAVDIKLDKFKFDSTMTNPSFTETIESQGGMELGAFVRGWFMVSKPNKINLVPYVNFKYFSWNPNVSITAVTPPGQTDISWMIINGGIGVNMPVLDNGMLAGGLSSGITTYKSTPNDTSKQEVKFSRLLLPQFNFGLEWTFTDWLTARGGYSRSIIREKVTYTGTGTGNNSDIYELNNQYASDADQTITLGLGFHFNRFSLEGTMGEKFFQRGPWVLRGHATDMFGLLSASYNFNK